VVRAGRETNRSYNGSSGSRRPLRLHARNEMQLIRLASADSWTQPRVRTRGNDVLMKHIEAAPAWFEKPGLK